MPTTSPFGLDGNKNQSLSPFDIKGKGQTKIISFLEKHSIAHTPPKYLLKSLKELPLCICQGVPLCPSFLWVHAEFSALLKCVVHAPPDYKQGLQKFFFTRRTWLYHKWPSYHQGLIHMSISQPRGGWLIHPTKWGYIKIVHMIKQEHYIFIPSIVGKPR